MVLTYSQKYRFTISSVKNDKIKKKKVFILPLNRDFFLKFSREENTTKSSGLGCFTRKKVAVPDPDLLTVASRYFSPSPSKRDSCGFQSFRMICIEEFKLMLSVRPIAAVRRAVSLMSTSESVELRI